MVAQPSFPRAEGESSGGRGAFALSSVFLPGFVLFVDAAAVFTAGLGSWFVLPDIEAGRVDAYLFCVAFLTFVTPLLMARRGLYEVEAIMRPIRRSFGVLVATGTAFLFFLTIAFSVKGSGEYSRLWMYFFAGSAVLLLVGGRVAACRCAEHLSRRGVIGRNVAILGGGEQARRFVSRAGSVGLHFARISGVYAPHPNSGEPGLRKEASPLGSSRALVAAARRGEIDDVVIALPWQEDERIRAMVEELSELPVNVFLSSDLIGYRIPLRPALGDFSGLPLFEVVKRPISGWWAVAKRAMDLILASLLLVLLAPLLLMVATIIKLDSPGPVLFRQKRLGFNNRQFDIYKFRSMRHAAGPAEPDWFEPQAVRGDSRITRVGRIIRSTSIDELPQLLNVLEGTMSLVGPRPHALSHNDHYAAKVRGYLGRHRVKPGITGWAQVNGLRGETPFLSLMEQRVQHDIFYADRWSLLLDLRILVVTAFVVLFQKAPTDPDLSP